MAGGDQETPGCPRRGRPRVRRTIVGIPECRCYKPCCREQEGPGVSLQPDEIELLRLIDLEGLEQEEAAARIGVSRKTAWRDLHEARRKIADALVNGKGINMAGCTKAAEGRCPKCPRTSDA
ncbi:DUF134 domain-containing protein [Methanoregula sp. PtaB.Bin085]|uniref:DUF134 domain-containing protein n=1 Tax=Methanoregula sp. PtaB.Bin085 TaxID=1811680 RepID=UPI0009C659C0|nr:DUF134 domain-containing protein [Methanoregula sp. PtaB.Bin085]OPX64798.1 MAG: hypothetical protein A4E33_00536 [Methanoregula sp. PtaB.Bin085]